MTVPKAGDKLKIVSLGSDAGIFALIVHGIQTLLVIVLGIYGSLHLALANRAKK